MGPCRCRTHNVVRYSDIYWTIQTVRYPGSWLPFLPRDIPRSPKPITLFTITSPIRFESEAIHVTVATDSCGMVRTVAAHFQDGPSEPLPL